jgi:hypothetical protein
MELGVNVQMSKFGNERFWLLKKYGVDVVRFKVLKSVCASKKCNNSS